MSAYRALTETGDRFTVIATPNGRTKYGVFVYRNTELDTPFFTDEANLTKQGDRERIVACVPDDAKRDVEAGLIRLAAGVARERVIAKEGKAPEAEDPFPTLEPWPEPVSGPALMRGLCALFARFIVLPPDADTVLALWCLHTYAMESADFTPYILVTSPTRECGKSSLLDVLLNLAYRAQLTSGITGPALYRRIDRLAPAALLDELDTKLHSEGGETLRGILNSGFSRALGRVTICVGEDHHDQDFKTFSPKVLSGIGRVWDTVESRSIPIRLQRASKGQLRSIEKIRGARIAGICEPYRRQLLTLAEALRNDLRDADPVLPEELGARQGDVWTPLLAIADAIGSEWPERARSAAVRLHCGGSEVDNGVKLLEDLSQLFQERAPETKLPSATIVEELIKREDRPWTEYRHDRPITASGVAKLLGRFDVRPKNIRMGHGEGAPVVKGYELAQLTPAFEAYLPTPPKSATAATGREMPSVAAVAAKPEVGGHTLFSDGLQPGSVQERALLARLEHERGG